jgi:hypothetical protein
MSIMTHNLLLVWYGMVWYGIYGYGEWSDDGLLRVISFVLSSPMLVLSSRLAIFHSITNENVGGPFVLYGVADNAMLTSNCLLANFNYYHHGTSNHERK